MFRIHKKRLNCRPGGALAVLLCHGGGSGGEAVGGDSFMTSTRVQPRGAEGGWGHATVSHSIMHTRPRVCEPSTLNSRLSTRAAPPLQSTRTSSSPLPPSHPHLNFLSSCESRANNGKFNLQAPSPSGDLGVGVGGDEVVVGVWS